MRASVFFGQKRGFALPTVLIASVVLLTILAVSVTATTAARTALKNQYYSQLAKVAGEAGVAYAQGCLQQSGNIPTWTDAKPLTPGTDCNGDPLEAPTQVEVLVVAGGGGGGANCTSCGGAGGGGGGGVVYANDYQVTSGSIGVTVGNGGTGGVELPSRTNGSNGGNSVFGSLTAIGGGGGGAQLGTPGLNGGSGGGGSGGGSPAAGAGGTGTPGQGNNGGSGRDGSANFAGGGGGGAGANGATGSTVAGAGGTGLAFNITGASVYYAGGGGGGHYGGASPGAGGNGGGGNGANQSTNRGNGYAGLANRGGGGGGASGSSTGGNGGSGGSGVVIVRYPTGSVTATGGTISTVGGNTIHRFTSSGTFQISLTDGTVICPGDSRCVLSEFGNIRTSFSVGLPTVDSAGRAVTIPQNGFVQLLRESTGEIWRTYQQPSVQPAVAPDLCSGSATSALGWTSVYPRNVVVEAFPDQSAQTIGATPNGDNAPVGTSFYRKSFNVVEEGSYIASARADDSVSMYIDGRLLVASTTGSGDIRSATIDLAAGCHTVVLVVTNTGIVNNPSSTQFSLKKTDQTLPLVVSDTSWRVARGSTVPWTNKDYYQASNRWIPVRDMGSYSAPAVAGWTNQPSNWAAVAGGTTARWISTTHSSSSSVNYPFGSYSYYRTGSPGSWSFENETVVRVALSCDDLCTLYIDGSPVTTSGPYTLAGTAEVTLSPGEHTVGIELQNTGTVVNPSAVMFSARRASDSVLIDQTNTTWFSNGLSWYGSQQNFISTSAIYRPTPDTFDCSCLTQGASNIMSNPSFETGTASTTPFRASLTRTAAAAYSGSFGVRGTVNVFGFMPRMVLDATTFESGQSYTASAYIKSSASVRIGYQFIDKNGLPIWANGIGSEISPLVSSGGQWQRVSIVVPPVPAQTATIQIWAGIADNTSIGVTFDVDAVMLSPGPTLSGYGDGSVSGWQWIDGAHASASSGPQL